MLLASLVAASLGMLPQSNNTTAWLGSQDYPRTVRGELDSRGARIELVVDTAGVQLRCTIVNAEDIPDVDTRFCRVPMKLAHFKPAHDEDGQPIFGIVDTNFYYRRDQYSHGPIWTDFTLTVDEFRKTRRPVSVLRVVTDAAGHVESCVVDQSSGNERLDTAACKYTRSSLVLAAPLDRDGRAVRAIRFTNVGFALMTTPSP